MTAEQQREKMLKRALPALAILVLYFAIGSSFVTKKSDEAKKQFTTMSQKGIDQAVLPGIEQDKQRVQQELSQLQKEESELNKTLESSSSFLSHGKDVNESLSKISAVLKENHLEVLDEKRAEKLTKEQIPKSLRDTEKWLKDMLSDDSKPKTPTNTPVPNQKKAEDNDFWAIHYSGSYLDNYQALSALASSGIKALPLSLTMQSAKSGTNSANKHEWILTLWL